MLHGIFYKKVGKQQELDVTVVSMRKYKRQIL